MVFKKFLAVLMVLTLGISLMGCASKQKTETDKPDETTSNVSPSEEKTEVETPAVEEPSVEPVTLRMAWWGSQKRHDITVQVIELYEKQNPNVTIEYEFYDFDGYITNLNTLVAANDVWDLFQLGGNFPTYLDKIMPINEYIKSGVIDISNTTEAFLQTTQFEDMQLSLASGVNTYGIAYDPQMFKDAGVSEPTQNWTWADFEAAAMTIHEKLGIFGSSIMSDFIAGASMGVSQEGLDYNFFASSNDKLGFDDPMMLEDYFSMRKRLVDAGAYPDPGAAAEVSDIESDFLVTGEAAMTWVAANQMPTLAEASGREIKIAPVPRKEANGPSGMTIQSSQMFCISKESKYPEEAAKFLNFFINSVEANEILRAERGIPIISTVRTALEKDLTQAQKDMYNYVDLVGSFETGKINVISPSQQAEIEDYYKILLAQVIYDEKTASEAAQEIYDFATNKFK